MLGVRLSDRKNPFRGPLQLNNYLYCVLTFSRCSFEMRAPKNESRSVGGPTFNALKSLKC